MSVNKKLNKPLILDSALGTELENRGEYLPSFKTSIWSASVSYTHLTLPTKA